MSKKDKSIHEVQQRTDVASYTERIKKFNELILKSNRIVFFGGAGVSTGSGIPDFRSSDGLYADKYNGISPEEILSSLYFVTHTEDFYEYYRNNMIYPDAKPNVVHKKLYELEKKDKLKAIVTQNIDGLHSLAGNKRIYELHGNVQKNYCINCDEEYPLSTITKASGIPRCTKCGGVIKPWVVLYGEGLDNYTCIGACREISNADLLIIAGTSLTVEPAASFISYYQGRHIVIINKDSTRADEQAEIVFRESMTKVFDDIEI